ncbi:hypothetical protein [Pedobacter psychrodurus]|uniref:hypothetical protein n=1 Tax=Pedobacter psychrodurus TaxID=2530456 RepID=UPI00292E36AF|nr:hypothetical protein [Pedobacter psychrodurus]
MALKDKFQELIKNRNAEYSDENVAALEKFISNNPIKFTKYFDNPNGQNQKNSINNLTGKFERFEINANYPEGELIEITFTTGDTLYVQTGDVFFDEN